MLRKYILIICSFVSMLACDGPESFPIENYPTAINLVSEEEYARLITDLQETPLYPCTDIGDFGFPSDYEVDDEICSFDWENKVLFSKDEMIALAEQTITDYGYFSNVDDASSVTFKEVYSEYGIEYERFIEEEDSIPPLWRVVFDQQVYEDLPVRGTELVVVIDYTGAVQLFGNWYTDVFIPSTDQVTATEAQELLYGETFEDDSDSFTPSRESNWLPTSKMIVPVKKSETIELRVCWVLYANNWEFVMDTQSAKILRYHYND